MRVRELKETAHGKDTSREVSTSVNPNCHLVTTLLASSDHEPNVHMYIWHGWMGTE